MSFLDPFRAAEDEEIEEEDEDDEDDLDEDEDDKVGTDEHGNETLKVREMSAAGGTDVETVPAPDVSTDRAGPVKDAGGGGGIDPDKKPPLGIAEIEDIEDDAKGG